jgi:hypothetical protein
MSLERLGAVDPRLGAPRVGLILGAFFEIAVEEKVLLFSGCGAAWCGNGGERRAEKNCAEEPNP